MRALSAASTSLVPSWFASARFGEAAREIAEALESIGDPEVLLRLAGTVATATSAAEVLAAIQKETPAA